MDPQLELGDLLVVRDSTNTPNLTHPKREQNQGGHHAESNHAVSPVVSFSHPNSSVAVSPGDHVCDCPIHRGVCETGCQAGEVLSHW